MRVFAAAGLFAAFSAGAQIHWPLPPCDGPALTHALPTPPLPVGLPPQIGGACSVEIEANDVGFAAALICPAQHGKPAAYIYAVRRSAITASMVMDFAMLGLPGDNATRIRDMQARHQTANVWDMCDVWGPARERFNTAWQAAVRPDAPPAPSPWMVGTNGTLATRPTYPVTAGVRSRTANGAVPVRADCSIVGAIVEPVYPGSSSTFTFGYPAGGLPNSVTLCVRR